MQQSEWTGHEAADLKDVLLSEGTFFSGCHLSQNSLGRLLAKRTIEPDFSSLGAVCSMPLEQVIFDALGLAGGTTGGSFRLMSGNAWAKARREATSGVEWFTPGHHRVPDWVVADSVDDWLPLAFVENKGGAAVNGGWGYCGAHAGDWYSNQVICYPHGCWWSEPSTITNAEMIWHGVLSGSDGLGGKGLTPRDGQLFRAQARALELWTKRSIIETVSAIGSVPAGKTIGPLFSAWVDKVRGRQS